MHRFPGKKWSTLILILGLLLFAGCKKHDSSGSDSSADAAGSNSGSLSGTANSPAAKAVRDELAKHWVATSNGYISEFPSHVYIATGLRADAESFYREIKELKFDIQVNEVSDADKLNGVEFRGYCQFQSSPTRVYNDPNDFLGKQWSQWKQNDAPPIGVDKKNGQWIVHGDSYLISGTKPSAGTIAQLK